MHFLLEQVSLRSNLVSYNVRARVRGQATYATACMRASMIDRSGTHWSNYTAIGASILSGRAGHAMHGV
jgi:hypothetical protein